ncbi:tRNA-dihydrouridine(20a/20b) synthase [NAD(P)+]-like [Mercenaria mercenaria]|uniref:tRNA-dihydrouridine(20a/20b) synthase [NAD(P)+]-like n=1 Tax=Mercenaria mercenaria TaxID=6596 RepID=UPI00234FA25D|nr:tRNA-dihydrouridine(20a/20b) synthase [NAD(P)+]-like [Mercenaria mercenaria]XP_045166292.2 tRNA-dihydrouridine(20a/20b) synthase [NAD(P)+]-like [Mercenaria mercenaria]XP_045166293.2 tRNA-dihydrouridine(20a/20b) synthase [NAD(P)+]-like [Mercenaria mercenaria]
MEFGVNMTEETFHWKKPMELFQEKTLVKICAPMVRYSKLPFRMLVRKYDCDLAFTPMIIANSFVQSLKARDNEFTTCKEDRPLIVQFAANNDLDFGDAATIVSPFADGVDLNCGCPQRWALQEGYGACLITKPDLVHSMVSQARNRVDNPDFTVSIKIRIHNDIRKTVNLCKSMEAAGVSWISVHGRTKEQRNQPVNLEAVKLIQENVGIPVIANGDIKSMEDAKNVQELTGVKGVMCARGVLQNPAMFAGFDNTPLQCIQDMVDISLKLGLPHTTFHHHLMYMCERIMSKAERRIFNTLPSTPAVLDYLQENYGVTYEKG